MTKLAIGGVSRAALVEPLSRAARGSGSRALHIPNVGVGGRTIVGGNVVPTPAQVGALGANTDAWQRMWQGIVQNDGTTLAWVKQQIDLARTVETPMSAVRIIGGAGGIQQGYYTRTEYLAALTVVADYVLSKGLLFYHSLASGWTQFGATSAASAYPSVAATADVVAVAQLLDAYPNMVGLDLVQEWEGNTPATKAYADSWVAVQALLTAIRGAGVTIPLTSSHSMHLASDWNNGNFGTEAALFDFLDFHVYYSAAVTDLTTMFSNVGGNIPILIGETGVSASTSGAARTAFAQMVRNLVRGNRFCGVFWWALGDQDTAAANQYGLYSGGPGATQVARTDVTPTFRQIQRRPQASAACAYRNADVTLTASATTTLPLDTTLFDFGGFVAAATSWTVPKGQAGLYHVELIAVLQAASVWAAEVWVQNQSGTFVADGQGVGPTANSGVTIVASGYADLAEGDVLTPKYFANAVTTCKGGASKTRMTIVRMPGQG
jgi:hypothetical protein